MGAPAPHECDHGHHAEHRAQDMPAQMERARFVFETLDHNNDGRVTKAELKQALVKLGMPTDCIIERIMGTHAGAEDGSISIEEFASYVAEREDELRRAFARVDTNNNGTLEFAEVWEVLKSMNVNVNEAQVRRLMDKIDSNKDGVVDFNEWSRFLMLHPSSELSDIFNYWRRAAAIDIGDNNVVPDDFTAAEMKKGLWWRHLVAGGLAGAVSRTATAPLDRLKTILQVQKRAPKGTPHLSVLGEFRRLIAEGGIRSMWRGNGVNVVKIAPETALKFVAYESAKSLFGISGKEPSAGARLCAGSIAGVISQTAVYPLDVLKTRFATAPTGTYKGFMDAVVKIHAAGGIRAFYSGLLPCLVGVIPYAGIDLAIYEGMKSYYTNVYPGHEPGILALLGFATVSSTCGQLASYPLSLVRTRLQAQNPADPNRYLGMVDVFRRTIRDEGFPGLYRGLGPNFLKVIPSVGISYVVYEQVKKVLTEEPRRRELAKRARKAQMRARAALGRVPASQSSATLT
eukprot:Opistho-1_new@75037